MLLVVSGFSCQGQISDNGQIDNQPVDGDTETKSPISEPLPPVSSDEGNTNASDSDSISTAPKGDIKEFDIEAKRFEFTPETITVNQDDLVILNITSIDVTHGFSLPDFGVNVTLSPNQTQIIEFVASKKGTFNFRCSVICGSGHGGMTGTLIVK